VGFLLRRSKTEGKKGSASDTEATLGVLVVNDDEDACELLCRVLQHSGAVAFRARRQGKTANADLSGRKLSEFCSLGKGESEFLARASGRLGLSARSHDRILRVSRTIADGDMVVADAACEYSMYASDITRTVPANGRFTLRQREIYDVVLGAQQAAIDAFVAGKSTINDRDRKDPNSLDTVAYNYINTHGKDLHGQPLGQYWLHGLGHMLGIDVHDPVDHYPAVLKPGMVFTIEPGIYIPEEKLGVRIECDFLVGADGKLIDMDRALPHTAGEVEAAMHGQ